MREQRKRCKRLLRVISARAESATCGLELFEKQLKLLLQSEPMREVARALERGCEEIHEEMRFKRMMED